MLHLDGGVHPWYGDARPSLILVSVDATKRILHAAFYETESQRAVMAPKAKGPSEGMFEYACHEGNYALSGILKGARAAERIAAEAGAGAIKR